MTTMKEENLDIVQRFLTTEGYTSIRRDDQTLAMSKKVLDLFYIIAKVKAKEDIKEIEITLRVFIGLEVDCSITWQEIQDKEVNFQEFESKVKDLYCIYYCPKVNYSKED